MELSPRKSSRSKFKQNKSGVTVTGMTAQDYLETRPRNTKEKKIDQFFEAGHVLDDFNYNNSIKMIPKSLLSKQTGKRKSHVVELEVNEVTNRRTPNDSSADDLVEDGTLTCRHCSRKFTQGLVLLKHERRCPANNSGESEQFACDICLKVSFKTLVEWNEHRQLHFEGSRFKCPRCDKIFTAIAGVENHLPYCRGRQCPEPKSSPAKPKCLFCQKIPSTEMTSHILSNHSQSIMIMCVCGKLSMGQRLHKEHLSTCRPSVSIMYACEICETFMSATVSELLEHKRNAHGPQNIAIGTTSTVNPSQSMATMNLNLNVINSLMSTDVGSQNLLPPTLVAIPAAPELVPGPSVTAKLKDSSSSRVAASKPKLTASRPPKLTQKPGTGMPAGNRNANANTNTNSNARNSTKLTKPTVMPSSSKAILTPPPLVKIPGISGNHKKFATCTDSFEFRRNECMKCGKKFHMKASLDLHTAQCDGKFVFKFQEYNIQEKDCAFLLALN